MRDSRKSAPPSSEYQSFGSFHTEKHVEDLIVDPGIDGSNPEEVPISDLIEAFHANADIRRHFLVDFEEWTFINHGAFGAPLREAQMEADRWRQRCERQPLAFLDRELFPQLCRVTRELASFLECDPRTIALVPNATAALNIALNNISKKHMDDRCTIMSLSIGYGSVKKLIKEVCRATGAMHMELMVTNFDDIPDQVEEALIKCPKPCRALIVDYGTYNTAISLPIKDIIQAYRRICTDGYVIVDGAHAPGAFPLRLDALGADFFAGNCHKWLCGPRGVGFLHTSLPTREVRPLIVSHGFGSGFTSEFIWDGNRDYGALLGVSASLRFFKSIGPDNVWSRQRNLLEQAVKLLIQAWKLGTWERSTLVPLERCHTGMALVALPRWVWPLSADEPTGAKHFQDWLHYTHRIECPVKAVDGWLWVRISCHIYNTLSDYEKLAHAVLAYPCSFLNITKG